MTDNISSKEISDDGSPSAPIWIIGEAPGFEEDLLDKPFVGPAGKILDNVLLRAGWERPEAIKNERIFITNVSRYRPKDNDFSYLEGSRELAESLEILYRGIQDNNPKLLIVLGGVPLKYLCAKKGIINWRGSIIQSGDWVGSRKCFVSLHPSFCLPNKSPRSLPTFDFDIRRALRTWDQPIPNPPFDLTAIKSSSAAVKAEEQIIATELVTVDIESIKGTSIIRCIGFGLNDHTAICFPFSGNELRIQRILEGSNKKMFHNGGAFDVPFLRYAGIKVRNYYHDTITMARVLEPELPRSLAYLCSIYTDWPYYKSSGDGADDDVKGWSAKRDLDELLEYCGKDDIVTYSAGIQMLRELKEAKLYDYYLYRMRLQNTFVDMADHGLRRDPVRWAIMKDKLEAELLLKESMMFQLAGFKFNAASPKQKIEILYEKLGLPVKRNHKSKEVTSDDDALIALIGHCRNQLGKLTSDKARLEWKRKLGTVMLLKDIIGIQKNLSSYFNIDLINDKIRAVYKEPGTDGARCSAGKFIDGSGLNPQTMPRGSVEV